MTYRDLLKEIANRSKETERKLAQEDVRVCLDLLKDVVAEELSKDDGRVCIKEFLVFDLGTQKSRVMAMYEDRRTTPDYIVPRVKLAKEMKEALKREGSL